MTTTATADQVQASNRLFQLADDANAERERWSDWSMRSELAHVAVQLQEAARLALSSSEVWADAWAEAGTLTLRKYIGARKFIEHVEPRQT